MIYFSFLSSSLPCIALVSSVLIIYEVGGIGLVALAGVIRTTVDEVCPLVLGQNRPARAAAVADGFGQILKRQAAHPEGFAPPMQPRRSPAGKQSRWTHAHMS